MNTSIMRATPSPSSGLPVAMTTVSHPIVPHGRLERMEHQELVSLCQSLQRQAVVRQTAQGPKVGIVHMMRMEFGAGGDVMELPGRKDEAGPLLITAKGYYRAGAACGLQIVHPQTVLVDGEAKSNPHYERNEATGTVERAVVRVVVVGRNAAGQLIARDQTAIYSPFAYLLKELHAKQAYNPDSIKAHSQRPGDAPQEGWEFFPEIEVPGTGRYVGLLVKLANPEVLKLLKLYSERVCKILEYAVTFAARNALKKMLEIHIPTFHDGVGYVPVVSWTDPTDEMISQRIAAAQSGGNADDLLADLEKQGAAVMRSEVRADEIEEDDEAEVLAEREESTPSAAIPLRRQEPAAPAERHESKTPAPAAPAPVDENGQAPSVSPSRSSSTATQTSSRVTNNAGNPMYTQHPSELWSTPSQASAAPAPQSGETPQQKAEAAPSQVSSQSSSTPSQTLRPADEMAALKAELGQLVAAIGQPEYGTAAKDIGVDPTKPHAKGLTVFRKLVEDCRAIKRLQAQERGEN